MKKVSYIFCFFLAGFAIPFMAQDAQFSQLYAMPVYLNPAYTGNTETNRFILKYRNEWPGISKAYNTMAASYDFNAVKLNSGFGLMYLRDQAGISALTLNDIRFLYSYTLRIDRDQSIRLGLNLDYNRKDINVSNLVFNDQLYTQNSTSFTQINKGPVSYFDAGTGAIYNRNNFWCGASVNHLTRPNTTDIGGQAVLPMYWDINTGYKIEKNKENNRSKYGVIWANYRHQNNFNQLDLGGSYVIYGLTIGLSYRGIPVQKISFIDRNDALAFTLGYSIPDHNLRFGYTYDLTVSRLANKSSGSHEISLIFEIKADQNSHRKKVKIFCPDF
jgi:type IX secretion system PorP/SprF family membrane protein